MLRALLVASLLALLTAPLLPPALAQGFDTSSGRHHPELDWRVAQTEHFRIHYPQRLAGIEVEAAAIAEASYDALSANLGVTFDEPIRIYLSDEDEIVNGFAVSIGNGYTNIWVDQNENANAWTGRDKWLRRVIPHELGHIFHYRATRSSLGALANLFSDAVPRVWTEGLAQYLTEEWDAERGERWLRQAALEGRWSYSDGASLLNGRLLYATGNSQVRWFAEQYGDSTLANLLAHRSPVLFGLASVHDPEQAFPATIGKSYGAFARDWRRHVNAQYGALAVTRDTPDSLGSEVRMPGQYLWAVRPAPGSDTTRMAIHRTRSLAQPIRELVVTGDDARIVDRGRIVGAPAWSADGRFLAWARTEYARLGSLLTDVYLLDTQTGRKRQVTRSRRASHPAFAQDGRFAFVVSQGGSAQVWTARIADDLALTGVRQITLLPADTQVGSLAWHPSDDMLAASLFEPDGQRRIHLIDPATATSTPVTPSGQDSREPIWKPDGSQLAFTSPRDGVPNTFRLDLSTGAIYRVTDVATGANAQAWLPPDSAGVGYLLVATAESKTGDRIHRVADSLSLPEPADLVPPEYRAWQAHRPPAVVPSVVRADSSLVIRRSRYASVEGLTHVVSLPFPYALDAWGIGGLTSWIEPLGKHTLLLAGGISPNDLEGSSGGLFLYQNKTLPPVLTLTAFYSPTGGGVYGDSLFEERYAEVSFDAFRNVDAWSTTYRAAGIGVQTGVRYNDVIDSTPVDARLPGPVGSGTQVEARIGMRTRFLLPYAYNSVHPLHASGTLLRLTARKSVSGTESRYVDADARAYALLPGLGAHRFYLYGRAQAQIGDAYAQDAAGLSRYPVSSFNVPTFGTLELTDQEHVRGYRSFATGDRLLFASAEYRMLVAPSLRTTIFGVISLGATSLALFSDAGVVWGTPQGRAYQWSAGAEFKNAIRVGGFSFVHALGIGQPVDALFGPDDATLYYRIGGALPF